MTDLLKRYYIVFFAEHYSFIIDKPIDDVLAEVRELLTRKKPLLSVPNITGRMTKYSFEAKPVWSFLVIKGDNSNAYLTGALVSESPTKTRIDLSARPNSIFFIFHIGFTVIGIIAPIVAPGVNVMETVLCCLAFTLTGIIVFWRGAYLCKKFLRETLEEALDITPQT